MTADNDDAGEDSVWAMYQDIDEDMNVFYIEDNGKPGGILGAYFNSALPRIEAFVAAIEASDDDGFEVVPGQHGEDGVRVLELGRSFLEFNGFLSAWREGFVFSEKVELFFAACKRFEMEEEYFRYTYQPSMVAPETALWQRCNAFLAYIREQCRSRPFNRRVSDREKNVNHNFESCKAYVERLFECYSRMVIIRVDLGYQTGFGLIGDFAKARKDLDKLLNNRRSNKLFKDMVGYIWKLEYGEKKGFHFHCIFFFNGEHVQKDSYYASMIGKYWVDKITNGTGTMYNCNMQKHKYRHCGIGVVSHSDHEKRDNLLRAIRYLTKKEQFLRIKLPGRYRVFGRGEMPPLPFQKLGRPRKE